MSPLQSSSKSDSSLPALSRSLSSDDITGIFTSEESAARLRVGTQFSLHRLQHRLSFELPSFAPIRDFPVDRVGVYLMRLNAAAAAVSDLSASSSSPSFGSKPRAVVCQVVFQNGSKVTLLRSNVLVRNGTEHALLVSVATHDDERGEERVVEPGDLFAVPLASVVATARLCIRPRVLADVNPYTFSEHVPIEPRQLCSTTVSLGCLLNSDLPSAFALKHRYYALAIDPPRSDFEAPDAVFAALVPKPARTLTTIRQKYVWRVARGVCVFLVQSCFLSFFLWETKAPLLCNANAIICWWFVHQWCSTMYWLATHNFWFRAWCEASAAKPFW